MPWLVLDFNFQNTCSICLATMKCGDGHAIPSISTASLQTFPFPFAAGFQPVSAVSKMCQGCVIYWLFIVWLFVNVIYLELLMLCTDFSLFYFIGWLVERRDWYFVTFAKDDVYSSLCWNSIEDLALLANAFFVSRHLRLGNLVLNVDDFFENVLASGG